MASETGGAAGEGSETGGGAGEGSETGRGAPETSAGWSRSVALIVAAAFFLENFDGVILTTATPAIAEDFGAEAADVGLAMTVYLLAVATFIPVSGWAADRWGARRVFAVAILLFTLASLFCAVSTSLPMLVVARALQGIAGSMMVPVGRLIVLRATTRSELLRVMAYLTWPALAAPVIAPLAGGFLTQYFGWPWIFYINAPIGFALLVVAWKVIPVDEPLPRRKLDTPGLIWVSTSVIALVLGLELVADAERALLAAGLLAIAVVSGVLAVRRLLRTPHPLLDLGALRIPSFRVANSSGTLYRIAVTSAPFLLPLLMQEGFRWSPVLAGTMVMWVFVGNLAIKPVTTPLIRALGFGPVIIWSAIGVGLTLVASAFLSADTPLFVMALIFLASGCFRSIGLTAYNSIQFAEISTGGLTGANTLSSTLGQLAAGVGIAVAVVAVRVVSLAAESMGFDDEVAPYRGALVFMGVLAALSAVGAMRLPPGSADHVRMRTAKVG